MTRNTQTSVAREPTAVVTGVAKPRKPRTKPAPGTPKHRRPRSGRERVVDMPAAIDYSGFAIQTLRRFYFDGLIPVVFVGRRWYFDRRDLDALIEKLKARPA